LEHCNTEPSQDDDDDHEYDNFYGTVTQHRPLQGRLEKEAHHASEIRFVITHVVCFESGLERIQGLYRAYGCWNIVPAPRSGNRKGARCLLRRNLE